MTEDEEDDKRKRDHLTEEYREAAERIFETAFRQLTLGLPKELETVLTIFTVDKRRVVIEAMEKTLNKWKKGVE